MLSAAFAPNDGRQLPALVASTLERARILLGPGRGNPGLEPLLHRLEERLATVPVDAGELRSGASVVFGTPSPYPPYEGEHGQAHVFMKLQTMADVAGFYRAFGVEVGPTFKDRPDHLAAELEFMHFLLVKEAHVIEAANEELARETRRAQALFLSEHLGQWAPSFLARVASEGGNPFYIAVAEFGRTFLAIEMTRLGVPATSSEITASRPETEPIDSCPAIPRS